MAGECHIIHLYVEKVKTVLTNFFQSVSVTVRIERASFFPTVIFSTVAGEVVHGIHTQ